VQSGAAAQILSDLFGDAYAFTDPTHESRSDIDGRARSFNSFDDFAEEAAISRLYGGIHYRSAIEVGYYRAKKSGAILIVYRSNNFLRSRVSFFE